MNKKYDLLIGILTYNRCNLLTETIESLISKININIDYKIILYDNGSSNDNKNDNKKIAILNNIDFFSLNYEILETEDVDEREKQISIGHKNLANIMLEYDTKMYCLLEDDWKCVGYLDINLFTEMMLFLNNEHIGQIRLRKCNYDNSLMGYSTKNFVLNKPIDWIYETSEFYGYSFKIGTLHWTNNPSFLLEKALRIIAKGFESELECMMDFYKNYKNNAQLNPGLFLHIGQLRKRIILVEKGYFDNE